MMDGTAGDRARFGRGKLPPRALFSAFANAARNDPLSPLLPRDPSPVIAATEILDREIFGRLRNIMVIQLSTCVCVYQFTRSVFNQGNACDISVPRYAISEALRPGRPCMLPCQCLAEVQDVSCVQLPCV